MANQITVDDVVSDYYQEEWGFTGTRKGMTSFQKAITRRVMLIGRPLVVRHGGAWGADEEFHAVWALDLRRRGLADVWPASQDRADLFKQENVHVQPVMPPLDRNVEIAKRSKFLLATPHYAEEELQSGTWHTIRTAKRLKVPTLIIWPKNRLTLLRAGSELPLTL